MAEPLNFSERLRAWRLRNDARAAAGPAETKSSDNVLPFRRDLGPGLDDEPKGPFPGSIGCAPSPGCLWSRINRHSNYP